MKNKLIQIPDQIYPSLVKQAKKNDRSVNKQIIKYIKKGLNNEKI